MKISENDAMMHGTESGDAVMAALPKRRRPVAPWWHTGVLILLFAGVSFAGATRAKTTAITQHHLPHYLFSILFEWVAAGFTWWGIRMRRTPLSQLLGEQRRGWNGWKSDLGAAVIFWIMAAALLAGIGAVLKLFHFQTSQKMLAGIAPQTPLEMLLWIVLSISAGICEEFIFRGYMLQQFASLTNRLWIGVALSSLLFGISHGYEGAAGMIAITAYGAMFCVLAMQRRSLRSGMMAHAWHDSFSGIALASRILFMQSETFYFA
jgi:membrane protease YdiL (CAAX protease family)